MNRQNTLQLLLDSLPIIAKISGGYAAVTDKEGRRIKTIDSAGEEITELVNDFYDSAAEAAQKRNCCIGDIQKLKREHRLGVYL